MARVARVVGSHACCNPRSRTHNTDGKLFRNRFKFSNARCRKVPDARSVVCYLAVRELGHNGAEVARTLQISRSTVSLAADRGEEILRGSPEVRGALKKYSTT